MIVRRSVLPAATVADTKLTVEVVGLTGPVVTVIVGWAASVTPTTVAISVLAVPTVVPVKTAV
jgi:hypothetical protein